MRHFAEGKHKSYNSSTKSLEQLRANMRGVLRLVLMTLRDTSKCRFCGEPIKHKFADLAMQPICESYIEQNKVTQGQTFYPLSVYFCEKCFLVQLRESVAPQEIFGNYSYFSSQSLSWLKHIETYVEMITNRLDIDSKSQVVEIGSNDGYLLQYFSKKNIPVLGIEPATKVAEIAIKKGIPTKMEYFGLSTSRELLSQNKQADLLVGNNILAQVPDLNEFVEGLKILLKPKGVITIEFHHLLKLMERNQFDTICHERFSYLSFLTVERIFSSHGLRIFDVEELPTHGGSLRIYARHSEDSSKPISSSVSALRALEENSGLSRVEKYLLFGEKVKEIKRNLLTFLIKLKRDKKSIVGYGAHAEGHTLLNYCGITSDFLDYTVDRNPFKQGKYLAGVNLPILDPDTIKETKPDFVLILPWNIKIEIMNQIAYIGDWGGQFIVPLPEISVFDKVHVPTGRLLCEPYSNGTG
jgi:hypothetical protein